MCHQRSKHRDKSECMQVVSSINNLIIGKIYVDHGGVMRITSSATGMVCKLKFREQGILSRHEAHEVRALLCTVRSHAIPTSSTHAFFSQQEVG